MDKNDSWTKGIAEKYLKSEVPPGNGDRLRMINTKHDVIRHFKRFPDAIKDKRMTAKIWRCSICKTEYVSKEGEMTMPAPCSVCEGIYFEKVR